MRQLTRYTPRFFQAAGLFIDLEGGFSNDPSDPGGPTAYGISSAAHPEYKEKILAGEFTINDTLKVLFPYWRSIPYVETLPGPIAFIIFDSKAHGSIDIFVRYLQTFINDVTGSHLIVDGQFGPVTGGATLALSESQVNRFIVGIKPYLPEMAHRVAVATMETERKMHKPAKDYTVSFTNRFKRRVDYAERVA